MKLERLTPKKKLSRAHIITLDTETKDGLNGVEFFCGSIAYIDRGGYLKHRTFLDLYEMLDACAECFYTRKTRKYIIFIQNLSFEERFIVNWCIARRYRWTKIESGIPIQCKVFLDENDEKVLIFRDSYIWLQDKQEKAEITYKIDEKYRKIDCSKQFKTPFEEWTDSDKSLVLDHNKNDVLALHLILQQIRQILFEVTGLDFLQSLTVSSFAMKAFRSSLDKPIFNPFVYCNEKNEKTLMQPEIFKLIMDAYFGGRVELFGNPPLDEVCCKFDVNSEYPWAMYTKQFPCGKFFTVKNPTTKELYRYNMLRGFADVTVDCPKDMVIPILPFRFDKKLLFPVGRFRTQVTTEELKYALENGYEIHTFHKLIFFEQTFNPFHKYVKGFYDLKSRSEGGKRMLCKMLLNSLSGKFGQKIYRKNTAYDYIESNDDFYDEVGNNDFEKVDMYIIDGVLFKRNIEETQALYAYNMPHLIAYITSYSRIYLHQLMKKAEKVYYVDTDSLVIPERNTYLISEYMNEKELGALKLEGTGYFYGWVPKCYMFKDIKENKYDIKAKGIPKHILKEKLYLPEDFERAVVALEEFLRKGVTYTEYCKYKTAMRKGNSLLVGEFTKKLRLNDKKRVWVSHHESFPVEVFTDYIPGWEPDEYPYERVKIKNFKTTERKKREFEEKMGVIFPDIDNSLALFDDSLEVDENVRAAIKDLVESRNYENEPEYEEFDDSFYDEERE